MSRSQVSRYERGRDTPNLITAVRYLDAVQADFGQLHTALQVACGSYEADFLKLVSGDVLAPDTHQMTHDQLKGLVEYTVSEKVQTVLLPLFEEIALHYQLLATRMDQLETKNK